MGFLGEAGCTDVWHPDLDGPEPLGAQAGAVLLDSLSRSGVGHPRLLVTCNDIGSRVRCDVRPTHATEDDRAEVGTPMPAGTPGPSHGHGRAADEHGALRMLSPEVHPVRWREPKGRLCAPASRSRLPTVPRRRLLRALPARGLPRREPVDSTYASRRRSSRREG